ncbi:MAG: HAMP domain-containing protein [Spirochaetota bacterium]|nr:MAG: HAMP domain-containing protein [Spirochaetota bacterium]
MRRVSIQLKTILGVIIPLFVTILAILYVSATNGRDNLLESSEKTLTINTAILNATIRNLMLEGEAPIVVRTMTSLQMVQDIEELELYRVDGTRAFHDYETLETVNANLEMVMFERTERLPLKTIDNENFRNAIETNSPKKVDMRSRREMEYYFPILNVPECRKCHGSDHFVRGVTHVRISTKSVYDQIRNATFLLIAVFVASGIIIAVILFIILRRIIIRPLLEIGTGVRKVGEGNFDIEMPVKSNDEVGELSTEINNMIKGLEERFHLSKYVSSATERLIKRRGEFKSDGEKQQATVLFSDIRNFTRYAESHSPREVIETLNRILEVQAVAVERYNGDIDKFIGDAIMAIFDNEYDAVCCAYNMVQSVIKVDKEFNTGLSVGIGMSSGEVISGNIGSESRLEYATIGDTVNVAARLSALAKSNMILITENLMDELKGSIEAMLIPHQTIKGKMEKVSFYVVQSVYNKTTEKWMR